MAEEINFENGRMSNFQRHVILTFTLTLDGRAIWHTVASLIDLYVQYNTKFYSNRKNLFLWTDGRIDFEQLPDSFDSE